jgi:integrase
MVIGKRTWKTASGEIRCAWIVRYRDAEGNYRQKTFKSKRDAEAWVAHVNTEAP